MSDEHDESADRVRPDDDQHQDDQHQDDQHQDDQHQDDQHQDTQHDGTESRDDQHDQHDTAATDRTPSPEAPGGVWERRVRRVRGDLGRAARALLKPRDDVPPPDNRPTTEQLMGMLRRFASAQLTVGQPTTLVEESLYRIASAYDMGAVRVAVLPTVVLIEVDGEVHRTEVESVPAGEGRLDQAGAVEDLVREASRGTLDPVDAISRLNAIRESSPRFGALTSLLGYITLCTGFGLTLNPTAAAIPAYMGLGLVVGLLRILGNHVPNLKPALPVLSAFVVTLLTCTFLAGAVGSEPLRIIAPSLVTFLPGLTLTVGAVELATSQVVAGASRVVYGTAQLLLLGFGVAVGVAVAGGFPKTTAGETLGPWSTYLGIVFVSLGYVLYQSAPRHSWPWIFVALLVAYWAQTLGAVLINAPLSGFVGALAAVPFTQFASSFRTAPPQNVMLLATFWFLVPGALSFVSLDNFATGGNTNLDAVFETGESLFAIALGYLVGIGVSRQVGDLRDRASRRGFE